jgi:hypothetical protein
MENKFEMPKEHPLDEIKGNIPNNESEMIKVFGNLLSEENIKELEDTGKILDEIFSKSGMEKLEDLEIEKTERDIEIINFVQESISEYMKEYNSNFKEIPLGNIHLLKDGGVSKVTDGRLHIGSASHVLGEVLIDRRSSDIKTAITIFHELWHLSSYSSLHISENHELEQGVSGFSMHTRDNENRFRGVDEALTGLASKRFFDEAIKSNEIFRNELNNYSEKQLHDMDTTREEETFHLLKLMHYLWKKNKDKYKYKYKDEILELFYDAQLNKNFASIANLIERTFGRGTFKKLAIQTGYSTK